MTTEENALATEAEDNPTIAEVENPAITPEPEGDKQGADASQPDPDAKVEDQGEKDGEGEKAKKPNRKPASERIAELTHKLKEANRRADAAEARLKSSDAPAPKRAEFKDDEEFEAARAKWAVKAARGDEAKEEADTARAEIQQVKADKWNASREDAETRYADFGQVISAVPADVFTPAVADALLESDMAADVAYVLAKDLSRARAFAAMTPYQQGREIGRIEAEIAPKPRKISSAPPPVETLGTKGPGSTPDPSKMSMPEYVNWRKSQQD